LLIPWQYFIDKSTEKNWFVYPWNSFHLWLSTYWNPSGDWNYGRAMATQDDFNFSPSSPLVNQGRIMEKVASKV
jgi:hypothetical protein